jgi:D-alanyl-D-alanine carboxypeptidase (penicillin-binding protein 5/6)
MILALCLLVCALCGCGNTTLDRAYDLETSSKQYGLTKSVYPGYLRAFAADLAVTGTEDVTKDGVDAALATAAGTFNATDGTVIYASNIYEKLFPASTTKILTAYIALKYCNLDEVLTVSAEDLQLESGASVCGLEAGDKITMRDILYGLLLQSGNEAANTIARYVSGSYDKFAELMNDEAAKLGATRSHFVNANGLTDPEHYTTVYDLYLIFNAAIQNEDFVKIIHTDEYTCSYTGSDGTKKSQTWKTTNLFLDGTYEQPKGVTVIGGKTGTTQAAGSCLVLLGEDGEGDRYISVVLGATDRERVYRMMSAMLEQ